MKKICTLLIVGVSVLGAQAQYQRLVLFEEFTQASCGPCASQNPGFNEILDENIDKATSIKYQVWWPGYDPMYLHNEADVDDRVGYYGVSGVPHATMDGMAVANDCGYYDAAPACVDQTDIDNAYAVSSPFLIELSHVMAGDYSSVDVLMEISTDTEVSGNLVAHIVIVERAILFESAPGSNGEKDFYNVMKKMLPNSDGTDIANDWYPGDALEISASWNLANVYNPAEIAVVAFIQNNDTKEILQAAYSAPYAVYDMDILNTSSSVTGTSNSYLCEGTATPQVTIMNIGADELTSCTVEYSMNGGAVSSFDWSGSLEYGESATVNLPAISFTIEDENTLDVTISNPNGGADGFDGNNVSSAVAFKAPEAPTNTIHLKLRTDQYASETTWEIVNEDGDVVAEGGPYNGDNNQVVFDEDILLDAIGCYAFNIYDSYGDGICCAYGSGYYEISDADGVLMLEGGEFTSEDNANFKALSLVGIENHFDGSISVFPNPANNRLQVLVQQSTSEAYMIQLFDMTGRLVLSPVQTVSGNLISLDVNSLSSGLYTLQLAGAYWKEQVQVSVVK